MAAPRASASTVALRTRTSNGYPSELADATTCSARTGANSPGTMFPTVPDGGPNMDRGFPGEHCRNEFHGRAGHERWVQGDFSPALGINLGGRSRSNHDRHSTEGVLESRRRQPPERLPGPSRALL